MLYELLGAVRLGAIEEIQEIIKTAGMIVLNSGGVVRGVNNWGHVLLPRRVVRDQVGHTKAHYFLMRFDSNAQTQRKVRETLGNDPRMVRFSIVRMKSSLIHMASVPGECNMFH